MTVCACDCCKSFQMCSEKRLVQGDGYNAPNTLSSVRKVGRGLTVCDCEPEFEAENLLPITRLIFASIHTFQWQSYESFTH